MKLAEAYTTLGLDQGASEEEAKKAFKRLAKQYHPDTNKDEGAEDKFKEINSAYQRVISGEEDHPINWQSNSAGFDINDIFSSFAGFGNPFGKQKRKQYNKPDITIPQTIAFRDSVVGCTREIDFKRDDKCQVCDGQGSKNVDNGCKKCKGRGFVVNQHGNTFMQMSCPDCRGQMKEQNCDKCAGKGFATVNTHFTVNIPPGITPNKNILNIGHHGHYIGSGMMGDVNSRVFLDMKVEPLADLKLVDNDVVSSISISLLEALEGCVKSVQTIDGIKDTTVVAGIRNKDEIVMPNLGLSNMGNHRIIVDVGYPEDVSKLIGVLKKKIEETVNE